MIQGNTCESAELRRGDQPVPQPAWYERLLERNFIPDLLIRWGIRRLLAERLAAEGKAGFQDQALKKTDWVWRLKRSPIAVATSTANTQHYEVPAELFQLMLGPHLKYSSCLWPNSAMSLGDAEEAALEQVCRRAHLEDGQEVLDLGCGWGSFSLYAATRYRGSHFLAVSNSASQRSFIEAEAQRLGLTNLEVVTADVNEFDTQRCFDRVVSIEMFEHMRNYQELMRRIAGWSRPGALLFLHIFCHRDYTYPFEVKDSSDWMAMHFFTGGQMPSEDLLLFFQDDFNIQARWRVNGRHYARTCRVWLNQVDARSDEFLALCGRIYGGGEARRWMVRWRVFLMACEELFAYRDGTEWFVAHLLFRKP